MSSVEDTAKEDIEHAVDALIGASFKKGEKAGYAQTVRDADEVARKAIKAGLDVAREEGKQLALEGIEAAREQGRVMGVEEGRSAQFDLDKRKARIDGVKEGEKKGFDVGYKRGRGEGYKNGWNDAIAVPVKLQKPK